MRASVLGRVRVRAGARTLLPVLLLAACGGGSGEDFTIEVKRPPAAVYAPLSAADLREARLVFPGIAVTRTRPSDAEILYTIPGTGSFPATIRLRLEPTHGGETTVVHAAVQVPPVRATIDGREKVLSESRVEARLQALLKATARDLEMGSSAQAETTQLSSLLMSLAVATDEKFLAQALDLKSHPGKLVDVLAAFDADELSPTVQTARDTPMVDPDAAERRHEMARAQVEWQQQEAAEKAAEPVSDLSRYDN
jgi:hypothetical protein